MPWPDPSQIVLGMSCHVGISAVKQPSIGLGAVLAAPGLEVTNQNPKRVNSSEHMLGAKFSPSALAKPGCRKQSPSLRTTAV